MAKANSTLAEITQELNDVAAQVSTFKPVLNVITDGNSSILPGSVSEQLEMIACLSEYINVRIGEVAAKLSRLDRMAA